MIAVREASLLLKREWGAVNAWPDRAAGPPKARGARAHRDAALLVVDLMALLVAWWRMAVQNRPAPDSPKGQRIRRQVWLALILLSGLGLRLYHLGQAGFWVDEANTLLEMDASWHAPHLMTATYAPRDWFQIPPADLQHDSWKKLWNPPPWVTNPPLYDSLLRLWTMVVQPSDAGLRLFAALCSWLEIVVLWLLARQMAGATAGLWVAGLAAFSPGLITVAQQNRYYAFLLLLATLSFLPLLRFWKQPLGRFPIRVWMSYLLLLTALFYTNYFGVLIAAAQAAAAILLWIGKRPDAIHARRFVLWTLTAQLLAAALFMPWVGHLRRNFAYVSHESWRPVEPSKVAEIIGAAALPLPLAIENRVNVPHRVAGHPAKTVWLFASALLLAVLPWPAFFLLLRRSFEMAVLLLCWLWIPIGAFLAADLVLHKSLLTTGMCCGAQPRYVLLVLPALLVAGALWGQAVYEQKRWRVAGLRAAVLLFAALLYFGLRTSLSQHPDAHWKLAARWLQRWHVQGVILLAHPGQAGWISLAEPVLLSRYLPPATPFTWSPSAIRKSGQYALVDLGAGPGHTPHLQLPPKSHKVAEKLLYGARFIVFKTARRRNGQ